MVSELVGDVGVVSGGAGAIGREIAHRMVSAGARVGILDITGAEETAEALGQPGSAVGVTADVRSEEDVERALSEITDALGVPSMLVTSAGILKTARLFELTPRAWDEVFETNVTGRFLVGRGAARLMIEHGVPGSMVNIGSFTGERVAPGRLHYCASNGAIDMLSRSMALDLGPHRIRVNTVCAGPVDTPMLGSRAQDAERLKRFLRNIPIGRLGTPKDVADAVEYFLGTASGYVTGSTLYLDGGWTAS